MDEAKITESIAGTRIHAVFNCLGSRVGRGKELFIQIDKTFVVKSCEFAVKINAIFFGHVTSQGANKTSMFFYLKVKGECEEELFKTAMKHISIYRPGFIDDRENDKRCGEKMASFVPFITKIKSNKLAEGIMKDAVQRMNKISNEQPEEGKEKRIYTNKEIIELANL